MDKASKTVTLMIAGSTLVMITFVYLNSPPSKPLAADLQEVEIAEVFVSSERELTTTQAPPSSPTIKTNEIIENIFCREFHYTGAITRITRNERPGLLEEVNEADVADDSIFFLETSCATDLRPRQSCSVESAARTNPEKQIYVLFISPEASLGPDGGQNIQKLKSIYDNIHFHYVDIVKYTNGTKMEKWVADQALMKSSFKVAHLSDGLRLITLSKYGGIYFDLDIIVMHSLQNMSNFAGDESEEAICNAVLSMKRNGTLVNACLDEFVNDYRGDLWSHNGPHAIERALKKTCVKKTRRLWKNCDGTFFIYPPIKFYPIHWQKWQIYFEKSDKSKIAQLESNSTTLHIWNKMSVNGKVKVGSNILYGDIASKYCPLSYWNSGKFF